MTYCTQTDIETRIGSTDLIALCDYDGDGAADADAVSAAIADADSLIDSYLSARFSVPVDPVPLALRARAVNLAVYFLRLRRDSATEDVVRQHEDDIAWLSAVAEGAVSLGVEPPPGESDAAPGVRFQSDGRLFGRGEPL